MVNIIQTFFKPQILTMIKIRESSALDYLSMQLTPFNHSSILVPTIRDPEGFVIAVCTEDVKRYKATNYILTGQTYDEAIKTLYGLTKRLNGLSADRYKEILETTL